MSHPMSTGRFYYDNRKVSLEKRIDYAAKSYAEVVGYWPNLAHVNPIQCNEQTFVTIEGHKIKVRPDPMVTKNITWMGEGIVQ